MHRTGPVSFDTEIFGISREALQWRVLFHYNKKNEVFSLSGVPKENRWLFRRLLNEDTEAAEPAFVLLGNGVEGDGGEGAGAGLAIAANFLRSRAFIGRREPFADIAEEVVKAVLIGLGCGGGVDDTIAVFNCPDLGKEGVGGRGQSAKRLIVFGAGGETHGAPGEPAEALAKYVRVVVSDGLDGKVVPANSTWVLVVHDGDVEDLGNLGIHELEAGLAGEGPQEGEEAPLNERDVARLDANVLEFRTQGGVANSGGGSGVFFLDAISFLKEPEGLVADTDLIRGADGADGGVEHSHVARKRSCRGNDEGVVARGMQGFDGFLLGMFALRETLGEPVVACERGIPLFFSLVGIARLGQLGGSSNLAQNFLIFGRGPHGLGLGLETDGTRVFKIGYVPVFFPQEHFTLQGHGVFLCRARPVPLFRKRIALVFEGVGGLLDGARLGVAQTVIKRRHACDARTFTQGKLLADGALPLKRGGIGLGSGGEIIFCICRIAQRLGGLAFLAALVGLDQVPLLAHELELGVLDSGKRHIFFTQRDGLLQQLDVPGIEFFLVFAQV